jgi:NAD(P)-dependent dehydrogenase (short-subunit alcohol dehydrogenase family)
MSAAITEHATYPSLRDRHIVVTGGGSGIGAGIVTAFARQGSRVTFLDILDTESNALVNELAGVPHAPIYKRCDLTNLAALEQTFVSLPPIDVLINNAANDDRHDIDTVTPAYWEERMAVNLRHLFFCSQVAARGMRQRGGGAIVNIGSISWHLGVADLVVYETAKAGIEGMTRGMARALGPDNIRVTCILPGNVSTPRQQRWYTPEGEAQIVAQQCLNARLYPRHVASLALFLASDDGNMCTGHEYWIDAGWR